MDRLEQFFRSNREAFDHLKLDESSRKRFRKIWNERHSGKRRFISAKLWKIAAVAILLVTSFTLFYMLSNKQLEADAIPLAEICLKSSAGEAIPLASLEGKVVLVEFWASWCGICVDENCNLYRPLYEKYQKKGFEIYAISLDTNKDDWLNDIEHNKLPWIQVCDPEGFLSSICQKYNIKKLPTTFLLNERQQIVGRDLNESALIAKLEELLDEKEG